MYANESTLEWLDANALTPPTLVPDRHTEYGAAVWVLVFAVKSHDKPVVRQAEDSDFDIYEQQFSGDIPQIVWYLIATRDIAALLD